GYLRLSSRLQVGWILSLRRGRQLLRSDDFARTQLFKNTHQNPVKNELDTYQDEQRAAQQIKPQSGDFPALDTQSQGNAGDDQSGQQPNSTHPAKGAVERVLHQRLTEQPLAYRPLIKQCY